MLKIDQIQYSGYKILYPDPKTAMETPHLEILHEDNHLIAVNKKPGWLVQGDSSGDETLADWIKAYIKKKYDKPGDVFLGIIHRLDRPTSGAVVFARTSKALERMNKIFKEREVQKTYYVIVGDLWKTMRKA